MVTAVVMKINLGLPKTGNITLVIIELGPPETGGATWWLSIYSRSPRSESMLGSTSGNDNTRANAKNLKAVQERKKKEKEKEDKQRGRDRRV